MKTATETMNLARVRFGADDTFAFDHNGVTHTVTRSDIRWGTEQRIACDCGDLDASTERGFYSATDAVTGHAGRLVRLDEMAARVERIHAVAVRVREVLPIRIDVQLLVAQAQKAFDAAQDATRRFDGSSDWKYRASEERRMRTMAVLEFARETLWLAVEGDDAPVLAGEEFHNALVREGVLVPAEEVAA